jgi:glycosyltransferase involved in cell wall biosynthesis
VDNISGIIPPVLVGDLHVDEPLPELNGEGRYRGARLLVRLHGSPVSEVTFGLEQRPLTAAELAGRVWPQIADQVAKHCADDGIPPPAELPACGLTRPRELRCATAAAPRGWPAITVMIATHNRPASLLRCLASVSALNYPAFDVVVTDSAPSGEQTSAALASHDWPFPVHYVRERRPGLALAHNAALHQVRGEIVAITDDDVEVDPGWLTALAAGFREPGAVCVTGLILPAELQTGAQLLVEQSGGFARGFTPKVYSLDMAGTGPLFPFAAGRFGSGANMAFRTAWLIRGGGFDAAAGAGTPAKGGDDLIAFLKVITDGARLVYQPAAIVRHWHRPEYSGLRRQAFGYGIGFGTYVAASVWARPALLPAMLRRVAPALAHLGSPTSEKNSAREPGFPRELVWRERAGMLVGPFAYALSRWRYRDRQGLGQPGIHAGRAR